MVFQQDKRNCFESYFYGCFVIYLDYLASNVKMIMWLMDCKTTRIKATELIICL